MQTPIKYSINYQIKYKAIMLLATVFLLFHFLEYSRAAAPTTQASNLAFSNLGTTTLTASWTNGNGTARAVFIYQGTSGSAAPVNNTTYTASTTYGSGTQIGASGWYCIYTGTGTSVTVTGLTPGTSYRIMVCEYNAGPTYLTTAGTNVANTTTYIAPTTQASNLTFSNIGTTQLTATWTNGNGTARAVFIYQGTSGSAAPVNNTTYTASTTYGSGTQIGTSGWYCIYVGAGNTVTVTGLTPGTSYRIMVCEYSAGPTYLTTAGTNDATTATYIPPSTQAGNLTFSNLGTTTLTASWTNGNGTDRAVFIYKGSSGSAAPVNNTSYTGNAAYGSGTQIGSSGWYCIYNGTGTSVNVTGLTAGTSYMIMVCEYNTGPTYLTTTGTNVANTTTYIAPTTQATSLIYSGIQTNQITASWTNGNGTARAVFIYQGTSGSAAPVNNTTYTASTTYGSGTQIGASGWYCIYTGTGTSVTVTGLTPGTSYRIMVCEYNAGPTYLTTAGTNVANTTTYIAPTTQASNLTFSNIGTTQLTATWTNGNGTARAVFIYQGTSGSAAPVNNTTYTASTTYGSGTQIGTSGWYCIYVGAGNTVTVTGLTPGTSYRIMVCEYSAGPTYLTTAGTNDATTATYIPPSTQAGNLTFSNLGTTTLTASWTNGNGTDRAVFIYKGSSGSAAPVNNTSYTGNAAYGSGTQIGSSGWYCIYNGTGTSVNVTGLAIGTSYMVMVCEYDAGPTYLTTTGTNVANISTLKLNQTINFTLASPKAFSASTLALAATASSGLTVTYTSSNTSVATVSGNTLTYTGLGTTAITAYQAGNASYNAATPVTDSLVVTIGSQTITFPAIPAKILTSPNFSPGATSNSALPVSYSSDNLSVATIVGGMVQIVGGGTANITASQNGNTDFNPATPVTKGLSVGVQTITFPAIAAKLLTSHNFSPGATSSSGLMVNYTSSNLSVATIVNDSIHIISGGTTTITASQPGNSSYIAATPVTQNLTVGVQTITFPNIATQILGNPDFSPGATSSSGLTVSYTSSNLSVATITAGGFIHIVGVGTSTITASQTGNASYSPAALVTKTLTVAGQIITFPALPAQLLTSPDFSPNATASSGLTVIYTSNNTSVATITSAGLIHIVGGGTASITASQPGNASYSAATSVSNTLSVGVQTITFPALAAKTLASPNFSPGATSSSGLQVTYTSSNPAVATIVNDSIHITGLGTSQIEATQPGNASYNAATPVINILTVGGQTITFPAFAVNIPSGIILNPNATASSGLPVTYTSDNPSVAVIVGSMVQIVGTGIANITANQAGNATYSAAAPVTQALKAGYQTITFPAIPVKTLTSANFSPGATASSGLPVTYSSDNLSVATIVNDSVHIVGGGTANITASQSGNASFSAAVTVTKALTVGIQTITFPTIPAQLLTSSNFSPGATATSGLPVSYTSSNLGVATIVNDSVHIVGPGTTTITASQPGNSSFSAAIPVAQNFTAGVQTITFPNIPTQVMGNPDFSPGATASSGLPVSYTSSNINVATITAGGLIHIVGNGTSTITAIQDGNTEYGEATNVTKTLTVASQFITFPALPAKLLNSPEFSPGATASSGLTVSYTSSNTSVAIIVNDSIRIVGGGTTNITASQPGGGPYSAAANVTNSLSVGVQTISFPAFAAKTLASADFLPGATASPSGLPITYTSSNPAVAIITGTNMIHIVGLGTTNITASQPGNASYSPATSVTNVLTVGGQTITFPAFATNIPVNTYVSPGATASSGLTVTYTSSNTNVATIVGNLVYIVGTGTANITASQAGNASYNAATPVTNVLNVGFQTITFPAIPSVFLNTPDFAPGATASSGLPISYSSNNSAVATITAGGLIHITGSGSVIITANQSGNSSFSPATAVSVTFSVGVQNITFPPLPTNETVGSPYINPGATSTSGLTINYSSNNTNVAEIVGGLIQVVGVGSATITASQAGNSSYGAATPVNQVLTVAPGSQTITFPPLDTVQIVNPDFLPGATASSLLPVTYTTSNPNIATIVNGYIHLVGTGTVEIIASQAGNQNYLAATNVSQPLVVIIANQTLSFGNLPYKTYGDAEFSGEATTTSGLPITYTSDNLNVAVIVNDSIRITGAGTADITASQPGNNNYKPAASITRLLTVFPSPQTINFQTLSGKYYGSPDFSPGATASSGLPVVYTSNNHNVVIIVNGKIHIVAPGTVDITASQPGNNNYLAADSISHFLTVYQDTQTITFNKINALDTLTYGDPDIDLVDSSSSGLTVKDSSTNTGIATVVNNKLHIVKPGTVTIIALQPGNTYYAPATPVQQLVTIIKANESITFKPLPVISFSDTTLIPVVSVSSGLPVSLSSNNPSVASIYNGKIIVHSTGTIYITASQPGNAYYDSARSITQQLIINKAKQTIKFPALTPEIYGEADINPGAVSNSGLPVTYTSSDTNVVVILNGKIHIINAGNVSITATAAGSINYDTATAVQPLVVNKATQILTFTTLPVKEFGDSAFSLSAWTNAGLPVNFSSNNLNVATIIEGKVNITGAGIARITANQAGDNNYLPVSVVQVLTVNKGIQKITFNPLPIETYGIGDFNPGAYSSAGLLVSYSSDNSKVATIVNGNIHITGAGTANITALQPGNANYNAAGSITNMLYVNAGNQTITFAPIPAKTFGDPDFTAPASSSSGEPVYLSSDNASVATIVDGNIHITGAGTANIIASVYSDSAYNAGTDVKQLLTVNKENQTIIFGNLPVKTFGDADFVAGAISTSGLNVVYSSDNDSVATIVNNMVHIVGAGSAHITGSQNGSSNFNAATSVPQYLQVNKASQTITFGPLATQQYGSSDFYPGATASSKLPVFYSSNNPNVATITDGLIHITGVGTATITATQTGNSNYNSTAVTYQQLLTVNKAQLKVTANNASRKYGEPNPEFTCWYQGFVNSEDYSVLSSQPVATTDATITSLPGEYNIVPSGGADANYEFVYVDGTLTIGANPPVKPGTPEGPESVCISTPTAEYSTTGAGNSTSYIWGIVPSNAGIINGTGKTVQITFSNNYTGKCTIYVSGQNPSGIGESSDSLSVGIIPLPSSVKISMNSTYCSNQPGDTINILNSQRGYIYQLYYNGSEIDTSVQGNGSKIDWSGLKQGTYSIMEKICNVVLADSLTIKEIQNTTLKPQIAAKWNDVVICLSNKDSVSSYEWFQNEIPISGANGQYYWTQQQPGYYSVMTTDMNGCQSEMSDSIFIQSSLGTIYPNPCQGQFTLTVSNFNDGTITLKIYSLNSALLKVLNFSKKGESFQQQVNVSDLNVGAYFVEVDLDDQRVIFEKLIIQ